MCVHDLAKSGDIQGLRDAVAAGKVDLSVVDDGGNTPLMTALVAHQWDAASGNISGRSASSVLIMLANEGVSLSIQICYPGQSRTAGPPFVTQRATQHFISP